MNGIVKNRFSICIGLFASLFIIVAISCFFVVSLAHASGNGKLKIDSSQAGITFNGYQIFQASIASNESVTDVEWTTNDDLKNLVISYITELGCSNPENAMSACSFIKDKIASDSRIPDTDIATRDTFASILANKILSKEQKILPDATFDSNVATDLSQGYWLFVTNDEDIEPGKNGSSPIWISVKDGTKELQEKTDGVTFEKKIISDAGSSSIVEISPGENIEFEITATLPDNYDSFLHYNMLIKDEIPNSLVLKHDIKVFNNEEDITPEDNSQIAIVYSEGFFTVEFIDMVLGDVSYTKDSVIRIVYSATLATDGSVVYGGSGNLNTASLTYTNDPVSLSSTQAISSDNVATVYTYKLDLSLIDGNLDKGSIPLNVGSFTVQDKESNKYINNNGYLVDSEYVFDLDTDGSFVAPNIKTGTYIIKQTKAQEGYNVQEKDIEVKIEPTYDGIVLTNLRPTISGGYVPPVFGNWHKNSANSDIDTGTISLKVANSSKSILLPTTGMMGIAIPVVVGIALIVVCAIGIRRVVRKDQKNHK